MNPDNLSTKIAIIVIWKQPLELFFRKRMDHSNKQPKVIFYSFEDSGSVESFTSFVPAVGLWLQR